MALQTKQLATLNNGAFVLTYDWDDVAMTLETFHAVNTDTRDYTVTATSTSNGKVYTIAVAAGQTINQNVPPGASNRLALVLTPSGKLDGVEWSII